MNCWEQRYQDGETGWDRGGSSLRQWFELGYVLIRK